MTPGKVKHLPPPISFWFDAAAAGIEAFWVRFRSWYRGLAAYRLLYLRGNLCDSLAISIADGNPHRLEEAGALLQGRFTFGGQTVDAKFMHVFDVAPPSQAWAQSLHAFDWLSPLAAMGGEGARRLATDLIAQWIRRKRNYSDPVFRPEVLSRRLIRLFAHGRFVVVNSDLMWRSQLFVSLREQTKLLMRIADEAPEGVPRIEAAVALILSGVALEDSASAVRRRFGLAFLEDELSRQLLPDGGHISRSPEILADIFRLTAMASEGLIARGLDVPDFLMGTQSRMATMIRFFRHGDGALCGFNGAAQGDAAAVGWLVSRDTSRGKPPVEAAQSGYCRLTAGHTLVLMDCGTPPPPDFSAEAHAGPLSFELSSGQNRLVVNCGHPLLAAMSEWKVPLRSTAAHSTVTLADMSAAQFLRKGGMRHLLGDRLYRGVKNPQVKRSEDARGWTVAASHDAYDKTFGVRIERALTLSPQGLRLSGVDRLTPVRSLRNGVPFAIRFHIHPDVRISRAQSGAVLFKLSNGEGWRFRADLEVVLEESVYVGLTARKSEQLVLYGTVREAMAVEWAIEQIGAA